MRDQALNLRRLLGPVLPLALPLVLGACAHNDVLVFGTETKLALDVEASPSQGGAPSVTLGYKRQEAVWLPLIVNGQNSRLIPNLSGATPAGWTPDVVKYRSELKDGAKDNIDTYSVFASFGANLSGNGSATSASGTVGLAQFFATGNAAINLSNNPALVTALKVDTPTGAGAQATAVTAASAALDPSAVRLVAAMKTQITFVQNCVTTPATSWDKIVGGMTINGSALPTGDSTYLLKAKTSDIPAFLNGQADWVAAAYASATALGCKGG